MISAYTSLSRLRILRLLSFTAAISSLILIEERISLCSIINLHEQIRVVVEDENLLRSWTPIACRGWPETSVGQPSSRKRTVQDRNSHPMASITVTKERRLRERRNLLHLKSRPSSTTNSGDVGLEASDDRGGIAELEARVREPPRIYINSIQSPLPTYKIRNE
ncbi:hypothetical protein L208DRAFT_810683 [Tricholoma matsutake]|nr:hypothetical protein L208DRAFT_810683 [Tricholoma matsutake 945]